MCLKWVFFRQCVGDFLKILSASPCLLIAFMFPFKVLLIKDLLLPLLVSCMSYMFCVSQLFHHCLVCLFLVVRVSFWFPTSLHTFGYFLLLYLYFWLCWVLLLHVGFLSLQRAGVTLHCAAHAFHSSVFSCCRAQALGCIGFSSCGAWV